MSNADFTHTEPDDARLSPAVSRYLDHLEAKIHRLCEALREIRDTDPVDNALDPQRPARIASRALVGEANRDA